MKVINPATGQLIREIETDSPNSIEQKYKRIKSGQSAWKALSVEERLDVFKLNETFHLGFADSKRYIQHDMFEQFSQWLTDIDCTVVQPFVLSKICWPHIPDDASRQDIDGIGNCLVEQYKEAALIPLDKDVKRRVAWAAPGLPSRQAILQALYRSHGSGCCRIPYLAYVFSMAVLSLSGARN